MRSEFNSIKRCSLYIFIFLIITGCNNMQASVDCNAFKNWPEGIEPEKISDGSIVVEEITDVIQAPNGYWYPKTIEVKQTSIRKDYKEVPLRITSTKRVYIQTNPEFPNGIFDINTLPGQ